MIGYVDGYLVPVPEAGVERYRAFAQEMGAIFREHGALEVFECVADDVPYGERTSFPRAVERAEGETVVFAWIAFESRAHRDAVNTKVMDDPRVAAMGGAEAMPFDGKRMIFGGFRPLVALR